MNENILYPEEEFRKVEEAIARYKAVLKTTTDPFQLDRVKSELTRLKKYREQILSLYDVGQKAEEFFNISEPEADPDQSFSDWGNDDEVYETGDDYLSIIVAEKKMGTPPETEAEILDIYMDFFFDEFLSILSERKLKLDFKYSMERENFHHQFLGLKRRLGDYIEEHNRIYGGEYRKEVELEFKRRSMKLKRNIFLETNRFFKVVLKFTQDLLDDLNGDRIKCLNGDDIISFEMIENRHYLEGFRVAEALEELERFILEVIEFLNIPDLES
ncbi:MAG: hypothetical protein JXR70_13375 [Spirochaetales bacterium]|nr:hypothetical protein [Spirochaetales bacterium]